MINAKCKKTDFAGPPLLVIIDCSLVDEPQWDCFEPDFIYAGCRHTFATLVFRNNMP